jgi:hypothetical protein
MTHPKREDWMSFLYDELPAGERSTLKAHLDSCAECRAQMSVWQGAGEEMSAWKLPVRVHKQRTPAFAGWAAAAAIVLLAVFGVWRLNALGHEVKALRAELLEAKQPAAASSTASDEIAREAAAKTQTLIATLAQEWEQKRLGDQQALLTALQKLSARHAQDYAELRKELETVAVFSEAGWQSAQNQISSLAMTPAHISDEK